MAATLTAWKIYIVEPESATNLDTNPSAELGVTGDTAINATVTQSSEQARYGKYSRKITPTDANAAGYYRQMALTAGTTYTFSAHVFGESGKTYTLRITDGSNNVVASTQMVSNGKWQRRSVSYTAASTATYRYGVMRDGGQGTTAAFYVDGHLFKTGSDNLYFDGDTVDPYQATPQFYWTGAPHSSTSVRLASTRYGGTLLDISNYATVRAIQGMGLTTFETNTSSLALGGEIYQNSHANAREFSLICLASTPLNSPYGTLQRKLARLEKAVNPKRMKVDQPMRLLIYGVDSNGVDASDPVLIDCIYEGGMEGTLENRAPSFAMRFKMTDPLIKADGYVVTSLSPNTTVNGGTKGSVLMISQDTGVTEAITGFSSYIYGITPDNDGGLYIYGAFLNYGDTNGDGIVYRNAAGSITSIGTGFSPEVRCAAYGVDGKIYIGGPFVDIGDANGDGIVAWNGSAISSLAGGLYKSSGMTCLSIAIDDFGNLYAGGAFDKANGSGGITVNNIAKWSGSSWAALGSGTVGVTGAVYTIICLPSGKVVFGGNFTDAGGVAAYDYLATFDGKDYGALGTAPDNTVYKLLYDKSSGILFAFGDFHNIGGVSATHAAYYDGNNWHPMPGAIDNIIYADIDDDGKIYAYCSSWTIGGKSYSNTTAYWNGDKWSLPEFEISHASWTVKNRPLTQQIILSTYAPSGSSTYTVPAVSAVTNATEGNIYPSVTLDATGYYIYSLYNRTTNERIFMNGLRVYTGEKIELIFSPTGYTITSNIRGDMRSAVLSGSSPTFHLQPGTNYVSCLVYPSPTAAVTIPLKYPAAGYISLNETVYE